jgi:predicted  nucleic acid-binding Zn-ribbon protein
MHPDIPKLLQLGEVDREIARLRAEVAALPRRVAEIETQLADVHAGVERSKKALKDIEAMRRKREGDIQSLQQKISKYRDQMLAVKTNQEYKALGNEINFAEQEIRLIEDKILEGMVDTERHESELKAAEIEQKKQQAAVEKEKAQAHSRTGEDQKKLDELGPQRETLRKEIDPDHLRHYDRVLKLRGSAMGEARNQRCLACHVQLRPQVFLDIITSEEFLICDSCVRILYFIPENNPGVAGPSERKEVLQPAEEVPDPS